ncbi:DEAD/DEAH box helicase [bacterium]|nr:DEAD/DEAH box helicase [bacterium]
MRSLLPKTYYPFFARFRHPSPIQERAAAPLLEGRSVLLVSATASGKTEAFIAPLIERFFAALKSGERHLLLVCPTRALVNDAARRLQAPLKACGLELRRRTSDASENPEEQPAALWITTPEGFDSLLCRQARWLGRTAAVILDEIHLLYGSPRGTQVACLLERLDWVCRALKTPLPQRVGATATASQPRLIADNFLGPQATVIEEGSPRSLRAHYHEWVDFDNLRDTLADLSKGHKVLLFASSRAEAEEAAANLRGLPPFGSHVYVHHSSLSRRLRLTAEQAFLRQSCALLCSTTTMEVGVDVGDIDWVVLLHPPEDRLGFVQRVGRSGRRGGAAQVVACYRQAGERMRYQYFLERAQAPAMSTGPAPAHESTVVQQALSLLFQNPRKAIQPAAVLARLPQSIAAGWDEKEMGQTLEGLVESKWLLQSGDSFSAAPRLEAAYKRGQIHANIGSIQQKQVEIREAFSGRVLGHLETDRRGRIPTRVTLGGHTQKLRQDYQQKNVLAQAEQGPLGEVSIPGSGPAAPIELESSQDFAHWLKLAPRCLLSGPQGNLLGHFLGSCWGQIFARHLAQNYPGQVFYADSYVVAWQGSFVDEVWNRDALWGCMQKFAPSIRRHLQLGRWFSSLPKSRQRQELRQQLRWDWVEQVWLPSPILPVSGQAAGQLKELLRREGELTIAGFFPINPEDL